MSTTPLTAVALAAQLHGRTYGKELTREEAAAAKAAGLVVVFGYSDDNMELRGAIDDEVGCYDGGTALVDTQGLLPDYENIEKDERDLLRTYFAREQNAVPVEAICGQEGYGWIYQTAIPHSTFDIIEDGAKYCRGIVFALADARPLGDAPTPA